jgi:hypothetical protein
MAVSGNPATRTLDAVWWVASIDPYGFRLSSNWIEDPFTCVLVSGVLKNTCTTCHWIPEDFTCRLTPSLRAVVPAGTPIERLQNAIAVMASFHKDALRQAIDLVERNCKDFVLECIAREAHLGSRQGKGGLILDALVRRLQMMFGDRIRDPMSAALFAEVVDRNCAQLGSALTERVEDTRGLSITVHDRWFTAQTAILNDLLEPFGLPGNVGNSLPLIEVTKTGGKIVYRSAELD